MRITQNPIKKFTTMLKETYSGKLPAQVIYGYLTYIRDEVKLGAPGPLKLTKRLKIFGQGFLSWSYFVYELEKNNPELYLSDLTQKGFTTLNINPELTRNKKIFHDFMRENGLDELCPDVLGLIDDGALRLNRYNNLEELLEERKKIVFKPFYGNSGKGVYICEKNGKEIKINGKKTTINSIKKIMTSFEQYLIEEYIYQADFLSDIFPGSPNTIRMIVMNPKDSQPFFPTAALRVGTRKSGSLDNFLGGRGGLSVELDVEIGELGLAASLNDSGKIQRHKHHPDTGSRIFGKKIEGWDLIIENLTEVMKKLPEIKYAGLDLLITGPGEFVVLEMNCNPGVKVLQIHKPLLKDKRVRQFYSEHGVPL